MSTPTATPTASTPSGKKLSAFGKVGGVLWKIIKWPLIAIGAFWLIGQIWGPTTVDIRGPITIPVFRSLERDGRKNAKQDDMRTAATVYENKMAACREEYYNDGKLDKPAFAKCKADALRDLEFEESKAQNPKGEDSDSEQKKQANITTASPQHTWEWQPPLNAKTADKGNGTYEVTIDPRVEWGNAHVSVLGHGTMSVIAATDDKMCSPPMACVGPEGLTSLGFARFETKGLDKPYVYGDAIYHELIGRFDNGQPFRIGREKANIPIPSGATTVHFMPNIRRFYLNEAGGGWVINITIQ